MEIYQGTISLRAQALLVNDTKLDDSQRKLEHSLRYQNPIWQ